MIYVVVLRSYCFLGEINSCWIMTGIILMSLRWYWYHFKVSSIFDSCWACLKNIYNFLGHRSNKENMIFICFWTREMGIEGILSTAYSNIVLSVSEIQTFFFSLCHVELKCPRAILKKSFALGPLISHVCCSSFLLIGYSYWNSWSYERSDWNGCLPAERCVLCGELKLFHVFVLSIVLLHKT